MAAADTTVERRFTPFIVAHKSKILPLLGDEKIADKLEEEVIDEDIHQYERLHNQPAGINARLKPHQLDGVSFLSWLRKNNAHGILADEMGLGKTLQILSFFQLIKNNGNDDRRPFIVVCPMSVLANWQMEIENWTSLKAIKWYGNYEKRKFAAQMVKNQDFDIVLTTFSRMGPWEVVVLDEGHRIKNFITKLSTSVKRLKTRQRVILTGTPIQNDLSEVWSLCQWLYPEIFVKETLQHWKEAFSLSDGSIDTLFLEDIREFLGVIMLRRLKQSTSAGQEIPAKKEIILHLPLTQEQKALYLDVITGRSDFVKASTYENGSYSMETPPPSPSSESFNQSQPTSQKISEKGSGRSVTNVLMELRKICVHPLLVDTMERGNDDADAMIRELVHTSSKFIALERLLDHEVIQNNKKMLIFAGFDYALDCCQSLLHAMNISHLRLDGNTPYAMRKLNVHRFQKQDKHRVFVIAMRAGGEGITLTSAEVIVFMDFDWNPSIMAQAEARAHRIGQTKAVTVVKLCTRGTVESQMLERLNNKLYLASKVVTDVAAAAVSSELSVGDSLESDDIFIRRLISHRCDSVTVDSFSADDLIEMNWDEIVNYFQHTNDVEDYEPMSPVSSPPSPGADSFNEQEKHWLSQSTSIKTVYDPEIDYFIDKESTMCNYGQAGPTLTKGFTSTVNAVGRIEFKHLKSCLICGKTRNLEECTYCPRAYHEGCANQERNASKKNPFNNKVCPHHRCRKCGLTANNAGGLLLACTKCPGAYCHNILEFEAIGYESPRYIHHITCGDCLEKGQKSERKRTVNPSDSRVFRSMKRTRGFDFE
uniref:Lymphoid-specific helicase n=1 Tax=Talaromyces marneffei PM1 TaxID=1077442 RepID=A0A093VG44_TALMA